MSTYRITKVSICPECDGEGILLFNGHEGPPCTRCDGEGQIIKTVDLVEVLEDLEEHFSQHTGWAEQQFESMDRIFTWLEEHERKLRDMDAKIRDMDAKISREARSNEPDPDLAEYEYIKATTFPPEDE